MKKPKLLIAIIATVVASATAVVIILNPFKTNDNLDTDLSEYVQQQKEKWYIGNNKKVSWYIGINWWSYTNEWTDYPVLKEVSQITGVVPKTSTAQDGDNTALKLRMANDQLPDLITIGVDDPLLEELI